MPRDFCCPECGARSLLAAVSDGQPIVCDRCGHATQLDAAPGDTQCDAPKRSPNKWLIVLGLAGGITLAYALSSAIREERDAARGSICNKHFKHIGLALLNYKDAYCTFPPAYVADAKGQPMHSWRVLILPFLYEHSLYSQYDFDEPWDGPNNQRLANRMPDVFQCPAATNVKPGFTSYLASVGPGRFFDGTRSRRMDEITDGLSNTMVMFESPTQVPWLDPLDGANAGTPVIPTVSHKPHPPRINVLLADGSVQNLSNMSPRSIEAMQTIAGGEELSP